MATNRRDFLKRAATSAVAAGGAVAVGMANRLHAESALATIEQTAGSSSSRGGTPGAMTPEERRRLVAKATFGSKEPASGKGGMMICAHPLATRAGADILRAGGNAADAVLAAAVTQTVVEPHMTGVTGVFSILYYDAKTGKTDYINGGMNAPLAKLTGWGPNATATGLGAGVPGFWAGFEASLATHGTKSKKDLCAAAIAYARDGFEVHPFMWGRTLRADEPARKVGPGPRDFLSEQPHGASRRDALPEAGGRHARSPRERRQSVLLSWRLRQGVLPRRQVQERPAASSRRRTSRATRSGTTSPPAAPIARTS